MDADIEKGNTPIADAFAYGRPVMPDAMKLIRKLETDRAKLIHQLSFVQGPGRECIQHFLKEYPLDKVELP